MIREEVRCNLISTLESNMKEVLWVHLLRMDHILTMPRKCVEAVQVASSPPSERNQCEANCILCPWYSTNPSSYSTNTEQLQYSSLWFTTLPMRSGGGISVSTSL